MGKIADKAIEELGYEPAKSKAPQAETPNEVQNRDLFQTPNYAVDLLVPFIPKHITHVWECAAGEGKISSRLVLKSGGSWIGYAQNILGQGLNVFTSDIRQNKWGRNTISNFLTDPSPKLVSEFMFLEATAIVTNPPFSLKRKFYLKCLEYNVPFALLIPADYSGWIIQACMDGAEKIIPTRRIDYITPNILRRIHEGEVWEIFRTKESRSETSYKAFNPSFWKQILDEYKDIHNYSKIDDVPAYLLVRYSSSDFHSMWLTWGFGLGKTETFVDLPIAWKKENI